MKISDSDIPGAIPGSAEENAEASKRRMFLNNNSGFTMVELIVVAAILGVLATLVIPAFNRFIVGVKVTRAQSEVRGLEKDILAYLIETDSLPNSLNDIGRGSLMDPWGNLYQYLNIANGGIPRQDTFFNDLNTDFDLYSFGLDGLSAQVITDLNGLDDIVRTSNGDWVGLGENF